MSGSPKPTSRLIAVYASVGLLRTICNVSMKAVTNPLECRSSHGSPLRGATDVNPALGAGDVGTAGVCGGGAAAAVGEATAKSAANSANCESGCQLGIP